MEYKIFRVNESKKVLYSHGNKKSTEVEGGAIKDHQRGSERAARPRANSQTPARNYMRKCTRRTAHGTLDMACYMAWWTTGGLVLT